MSDSRTGSVTEEALHCYNYRYEWAIPHFCVCHYTSYGIESAVLKSPDFKVGGLNKEVDTWHLELNTAYKCWKDAPYYLSLYIVNSNSNLDDKYPYFHLNVHFRMWYEKRDIPLTNKKREGICEFFKHADLSCKSVHNGILTIHCEITLNKTEINEHSISNDLKLTLDNQKFSDLTLVVEEQEIRVHKVILASRSSVFAAMLDSEMAEKANNKVHITDIDYETMKLALLYIYSGNVENMNSEVALKLLAPANKYALDGLKNTCGVFLSKALKVENAFETLVFADRYLQSQWSENKRT